MFSPNELLVSNTLLFGSHIGLGVYLYNRRHMRLATQPWRITYSACGSLLFNLGNVMLCAVTKVLFPRNDALRTVFGIATGVLFLMIAGQYIQFVDDKTDSNNLWFFSCISFGFIWHSRFITAGRFCVWLIVNIFSCEMWMNCTDSSHVTILREFHEEKNNRTFLAKPLTCYCKTLTFVHPSNFHEIHE